MKKLNLLFVALIGAMTFGLSSCTDECKDVVCDNGGTCVEGVCDCPDNYYGDNCEVFCENGTYADGTCGCDAGYEGETCSTVSRDKFIGSYSVTEVCGSGSDSYTSTVTVSSTNVETVLISNVYNLFVNNVTATVSGSDVTIASQTPDNDGVSISGNGSINEAGTVMTLTFTLTDGTDTDSCTGTYTKQ